MLVCDKSDVFLGAKVRLNDGRLAEVNEDTSQHDMVIVLVDGQHETVYVGEALEGDTWIAEILAGQSSDPEPACGSLHEVKQVNPPEMMSSVHSPK